MSPDPNGLQLPSWKDPQTHVQLPELAVQVTQIEILYSAIGVTRGIHVNNARGLAHPGAIACSIQHLGAQRGGIAHGE